MFNDQCEAVEEKILFSKLVIHCSQFVNFLSLYISTIETILHHPPPPLPLQEFIVRPIKAMAAI
jgi:hypothetical protein